MRYPVIDGLRGCFLILMVLSHAGTAAGFNPHGMLYHNLGWADAAQGFVLLSGGVVGLVYGRLLIRRGFRATRSAVFARALLVFKYHACLVLAVCLLAVTMTRMGIESYALASFGDSIAISGLLSLSLAGGPLYMGILPLYIVFLLFTPFALLMLWRGHWLLFSALVIASWGVAQTGIVDLVLVKLAALAGLDPETASIGIAFNRFSWQAIYFVAMAAGYAVGSGRIGTAMFGKSAFPAFLVALGMTVFFGLLDLFSIIGANRGQFDVVHVLNLAAVVFVLTFMLSPENGSRPSWLEPLATALRAIFRSKPLSFLGQHSLQVFAFHIPVAYACSAYVTANEPSPALRATILGLALVSLYIPAWLHVWWSQRKPAVPDQAGPAGAAWPVAGSIGSAMKS